MKYFETHEFIDRHSIYQSFGHVKYRHLPISGCALYALHIYIDI